jgi:sigma-B regulation protein RsbU (phosphoserine phosphatase)
MAVESAFITLWPRLFVVGLLLSFTLWALRRRGIPGGRWLLCVPLVLLARDMLSVAVAREWVFLLADVLIAFAYLSWLDSYLRRPLLRVLLVVVAVPAIALRMATGGAASPLLVRLLSDILVPAGAYTLIVVTFIEIRELYVADAGPILRCRSDALALLVPTYLLPMVQGYDHPLVLSVLVPLTYIAHFRVVFEYHQEADTAMREAIDFRDTNINTLFEFMAKVRNAILEQQPEESVLQYALQTLVGATGADAGAILVLDDDGRTLRARAVEGFFPPPYEISEATKKKIGAVEKYFKGRPIDTEETVLGEVVQHRRGLFLPEPERHERLAHIVDDDVCYMSSFIAVPILLEGRLYGVASVVRRQNQQRFGQADFDHAMVLGEYASVTLANLLNYMEVLEKEQLESELRMAADIQRNMLPGELPRHPRVDLAAFSRPARNVGGDYYDVVTPGEGLGVLVCDVAGKGVPAALIMVMVRTIFRMSQEDSMDPGPVTSWINRGVSGNVDTGRFATLTYVSLDRDSNTLRYSNAGHLPSILVHRDEQEPRWLPAEEIPIGIESGTDYVTREVSLRPGDTLVLYTDGLAEARSPGGEEFGEDRIADVVVNHRHESADDILAAVRERVDEFVQDETQQDDQTIVIMKLQGPQ